MIRSKTLALVVALAAVLYYLRRPSEIKSVVVELPPRAYQTQQIDHEKRNAVLEAFKDSYGAYERDAFGKDNYHPISQKGHDMSEEGPIGYFIIDSLDSLLLMGQTEEYQRARDWVSNLSFDLDDKFHTFEITIRLLGGLLSAYHLSENDQMYLEKAIDLADRILPAFDTPSGLPYSFVNLSQGKGIPDADNHGFTSLAEAGTLQLEFKYLTELSGNPIYWQKVTKVMEVINNQKLPNMDGLGPIFLSATTGEFVPSEVRLGSRSDSYYEYLIKQYLQTGQTESVYLQMYTEAMQGIKSHLLRTSVEQELIYTMEKVPRRTREGLVWIDVPKQDHLVCFIGGSFILGSTLGRSLPPPSSTAHFSPTQADDLYLGRSLIHTCMDTYNTLTGLGPEIVMYYNTLEDKIREETAAGRKEKSQMRDWYINSRNGRLAGAGPEIPPHDAKNMLRPETVESLFLAYRLTSDPIYREYGWQIFESFRKHCKISTGGFATIRDVDEIPVVFDDNMETFWIAETLKYLYLLFSDDNLVPLGKYMLNTEAHILPIFIPTVVTS